MPRRDFEKSDYKFYEAVDLAFEHVWDGPETYGDCRRRLLDLTAGQRVLLPVVQLDGEVCNGGFEQYFFNSYSMFAAEAYEGLVAIGASKYAALLKRAMKIYPDGKVPRQRERRWPTLQLMDHDRIKRLKAAIKSDKWDDVETAHPKIHKRCDNLNESWYELNNGKMSLPNRVGPKFIEAHLDEFIR
jgi:hypothetical protein